MFTVTVVPLKEWKTDWQQVRKLSDDKSLSRAKCDRDLRWHWLQQLFSFAPFWRPCWSKWILWGKRTHIQPAPAENSKPFDGSPARAHTCFYANNIFMNNNLTVWTQIFTSKDAEICEPGLSVQFICNLVNCFKGRNKGKNMQSDHL